MVRAGGDIPRQNMGILCKGTDAWPANKISKQEDIIDTSPLYIYFRLEEEDEEANRNINGNFQS